MKILNDPTKYEVINFGLGGKTMMKKGNDPYWDVQFY